VGMNGLDYSIIGIVVAGIILGYYRGFIAQIISLAGFFIAYIIAFKFYRELTPVLHKWINLPSYESYQTYGFLVEGLNLDTYIFNALSFAILFFGTKLSLSVVGRLLNLIAKFPGINFLNRWSGALLGAAEAILIVIIAVNVLTIMPSEPLHELVVGSRIAPYLINDLPSIAGKLQELWRQ
jgi:uncharacterized membrane protein required for colicin V production